MAGMDRTESERSMRFGSVKEAVNIYGQRIPREKPEKKKAQMLIPEVSVLRF